MTDREPRCWRCQRKIAEEATRPWRIICGRCHATNKSPVDMQALASTLNATE